MIMSKKGPARGTETDVSTCGIVMPIGAWGEYDVQHWLEVRDIINRAVKAAGMKPRPVWEGGQTDIIQSRIVRNLYENAVIVCDISGLNPNVMFELGMRLTFRKPVVIIAEEATQLPFDTNVIDTLSYPPDLHFSKIEQFMKDLATKITNLVSASEAGSHKPYLDTFGAFTVVVPQADRVEFDQFVIEKLDQIGSAVDRLQRDAILRDAKENALANPSLDPVVSSSWTFDRLKRLVDMWWEGKTASEIAGDLGGVSRNAVIGKAHRLGLPSRPYPPPEDDPPLDKG